MTPSPAAILLTILTLLAPASLHAQDFWMPANEGLEGATVSSFHLDGDGRIYAVTAVGIYRSDDRGASWRQSRLITSSEINSVVVAPNGTIHAIIRDSIYTSRDRGESWTSRERDGEKGLLYFFGVDVDGLLYGGMPGVIVRSSDDGITWDTILSRSRVTARRFVSMVLDHPDLMLVLSDSSLLISIDRGSTWESAGGPEAPGEAREYHRGAVTPDGSILLATSRGLFRSTDRAASWMQVDTLPVYTLHVGKDRSVYQVVGSPPHYVSIGRLPQGVRVSTDNGTSWRTVREDRSTTNILADGSGSLVVATYRDVERSLDGGRTWSPSNRGLSNFRTESVVSGPDGALVTSRSGRPAFSSDDGASWSLDEESMLPGVMGVLSDGSLLSGHDYGWTDTGRIDRSTDRGRTWMTVAKDLTGTPMCFTVTGSGEILVGTGQNGGFGSGDGSIYRSVDGGAGWDTIGFGLPISQIAVKGSGDLFALSYSYSDVGYSIDRIHRSTDRDITWMMVSDSTVEQDVYTADRSAIVIDRKGVIYSDLDLVVAARSADGPPFTDEHYILRSTDNGDSWTAVRLAIPDDHSYGRYGMIEAVAIDSSGAIYAGTYDRGILRSTDEGRTWERFNSGLLNLNIRSITVTPSGFIIVGTGNNGFYRSRIAPTVPVTDEPVAETIIYPNPASGPATISFTNPVDGAVTIELYTVAGERVATLLEGRRAAGPHEVRFDVSGLADGVYLYRITSGGRTMSGRLTVISSTR